MSENLNINADVQGSAREVLAIVAKSLMSAIKGGAEEARMALDAELQKQAVAHAFAVERVKQEAVTGLLAELQKRHEDLVALESAAAGRPLALAYERQRKTVERQMNDVLVSLGIDVAAVPKLEHGPEPAADEVVVQAHTSKRRGGVLNGHHNGSGGG
jgi:cell division FtsZ-interacting protein ZapD